MLKRRLGLQMQGTGHEDLATDGAGKHGDPDSLPVTTPGSNEINTSTTLTPPISADGTENGHSPTSKTTPESKTKQKQKQKRNKPTLSCLECVDRKTKCDRARPCLACVKRQSSCRYTAVADLIVSTDRKNKTSSSRRVVKPSRKSRNLSTTSASSAPTPPPPVTDPSSAHHGPPYLYSDVPCTLNSPSNVFGQGRWVGPRACLPSDVSSLPRLVSLITRIANIRSVTMYDPFAFSRSCTSPLHVYGWHC
jgi:hypothetical protein